MSEQDEGLRAVLVLVAAAANWPTYESDTADVQRAMRLSIAPAVDAITAHLGATLAGLRGEVVKTIHDRTMPGQSHPADDPREERPCRQQADAVLAVVRAGLLGTQEATTADLPGEQARGDQRGVDYGGEGL